MGELHHPATKLQEFGAAPSARFCRHAWVACLQRAKRGSVRRQSAAGSRYGVAIFGQYTEEDGMTSPLEETGLP